MPAILGAPIASTLHLPTSVFFGLFSGALLLSAVVGPSVGRLIDRHGGRHLLAAWNLVIAAGLLIPPTAHNIVGLVIAWTILGIGIGMGLYDPAFATLTWLYGRDARSSITGITLIAGFASTIGWPLTPAFLDLFGWRAACLVWAGLNMLLAAPVNWLAIPRHGVPAALPQATTETAAAPPPSAAMPILAFFFAATWFVQGAMAAHLPGLLQAAGASSSAAIAAASLVGPAQVGARIVEVRLLRSFHPISSARLAFALHTHGARLRVAVGPAPRGRPDREVSIIALVPPDLLGAARFRAASDWRRLPCRVRCSRNYRVRAVAWRRQRHDHDREGHFAIGIVRPKGVRAAQRFAVGTGPDAASGSSVSVWPFTRPGRARRGRIISWAVSRRFRRAVPVAAAPRGRSASLARPQFGRESPDDGIVQGSPPPTVGMSAEAKLGATDRLSPRKWRVLSAVCSV